MKRLKWIMGLLMIGGSTVFAEELPVFNVGSFTGVVTSLYSFSEDDWKGATFRTSCLVQGTDCDFYGTYGGNNVDFPNGMIFKLSASGTMTPIYRFTGKSDGAIPVGGLVQGKDGFLYGVTEQRGLNGEGTIFQISISGSIGWCLSLTDESTGSQPEAALIQGIDGCFYGTTQWGGACHCGTVFKITRTGEITILYSFTGNRDGAAPAAGLVSGSDGTLYGTTSGGGEMGEGTVFKLTTGGEFTTLHFFNWPSGANPWSGLVWGNEGDLYGTTADGGDNGVGTVYKISIQGAFTVLNASFNWWNGAHPESGLCLGNDGNFYGTTQWGAGLFEMTPGGLLTPIYSFNWVDGAYPTTGLIQGRDGFFYGMTASGGTAGFGGTIFKMCPLFLTISEGKAFIDQFSASGNPFFSATVSGSDLSVIGLKMDSQSGLLSGTPSVTGTFNIALAAVNSSGTGYTNIRLEVVAPPVVELLNWQPIFTTLHEFDGDNGSNPQGGLITGLDGNLYGITSRGGSFDAGTIFQIAASGSFNTIYSFHGKPEGANPQSGLVQGSDGLFYGTTCEGGSQNKGTVYALIVTGTQGSMSLLHSFTGWPNDGANPLCGFTPEKNGVFYAATSQGGTDDLGTIYSVDVSGSLGILYSFGLWNDGYYPDSALVQGTDGDFYGTTRVGGLVDDDSVRNYGVFYKITKNGLFTLLHTFNFNEGYSTNGTLLPGADGSFYGTNQKGGPSDEIVMGTVFKLTPDGTLSTIARFKPEGLNQPSAGLISGNDGFFYGTTMSKGTCQTGGIFKISISGSLTSLYSFSEISVTTSSYNGKVNGHGIAPNAALTLGPDGSFYGMTPACNERRLGTLFPDEGTLFRITRPAMILKCGMFWSYQIQASNNPTGYELIGAPPEAWVEATGLIHWTPLVTGTYQLSLNAKNSAGTGTALVTVIVQNPPEIILNDSAFVIPAGAGFQFQIPASNRPSQYAVIGSLPSGLFLNPNTGLISGTPMTLGLYDFAVSASNGVGTVTASLTMTVNEPLQLVSIAGKSWNLETLFIAEDQGTGLSLPIVGNNPSGNSILYQLGSGAPKGSSLNSVTGLFQWIPVAGQAGVSSSNYWIQVTAQDAIHSSMTVTRRFQIRVNHLDSVPEVQAISPQVAAPGWTMSFRANASDLDVSNGLYPASTLNYSLAAGAPGIIDANTGLYTWTVPALWSGTDFKLIIQVNKCGSLAQTEVVPVRADLRGPMLQMPRYSDTAQNSNGLLKGFTISNRSTLSVSASSSFGVKQVVFFDIFNGSKTLIESCTQPTNEGAFNAVWPVDLEQPGTHTVEMVATDCYGLLSSTLSVTGFLQLPLPASPLISTLLTTTALSQILFSGSTQSNCKIQWFQNGISCGTGIVDATGLCTLPLSLSGTGANDFYAVAINQTGTSGTSNHLTVTLDYSKPSAPLGLTATAIAGGKIRLVWQQPASGAVSYYNVLRSCLPGMGAGSSLNESNTMIVDVPPPLSGTCYYRVEAIGANGVEGDASNLAFALPDAQAPSAISLSYALMPGGAKSVAGRFGTGCLLVTAKMSKALAAIPQLFYAIGGNSMGVNLVPVSSDPLTYIGTLPIPSDFENGVATAVLSARDLAGNIGHWIGEGGQIVIRTKGPTLSAEGTGIPHYFKIGGSVMSFPVQFDEPVQTGSDGLFVRPTFYLINSGTTQLLTTGSFEATGVVQGSDDGRLWIVVFDAIPDSGQTGELALGYRAVDDFCNQIDAVNLSAFIAVYSNNAPLLTREPTQLAAISGSGGSVSLSWQPVDTAAGYNVYRAVMSQSGMGDDILVNATGMVTGSTVWVDCPLQDGTYSYGITSVRVAGNDRFQSSKSSVSAVSRSAPPPTVSGTPSCMIADKGEGIRVEWNSVGDAQNGISIFYHLFRSRNNGTDPVAVSGSISTSYAVDPNPDPARPYYFVTVLDEVGNESGPSLAGGPAFSVTDLLPVSALSVIVDHEAVPRLEWSWESSRGYDGFDVYRVDQSGSTLLISATETPGCTSDSYADIGYLKGTEPVYSVVPYHRDGMSKGIPRQITLPQVRMTVDAGSSILLGLMNRIGFTVESGAARPIQNARLKITLSGTASRADLFSPWFILPANSGTAISLVIPGYSDIGSSFMVTLVSVPQVGEMISISNAVTIPVISGGLEAQVLASNFIKGGGASAQFSITNPGNEPFKLRLASPGGPSPDVRFKLIDQNGGVLAIVPFIQTNQSGNNQELTGAIFSSAAGTFLTIPPKGSFLTSSVQLPVPATASDTVMVRLELDQIYGNEIVLPVNFSTQRIFTTLQTAYTGMITDVNFNRQSVLEGSAIDVTGSSQSVTLSGSASYRETQMLPPSHVPLVLAISVNGFERDYNINTHDDGTFAFDFRPDFNERGGIYSVWVRHPDVQDVAPQRTFILSRVTSEYGLYQLITPNNVEQILPVRIYTGHQTVVSNLTLVYVGNASDGSPCAALPEGVTVNTGTISVMSEDSTVMTELRFQYTGSQLTKPIAGKLFFRLVSDENPCWQTIELNYQVVNSAPVLQVTPAFIETGIQVSSTSTHSDTQTVRLSNIGQAALEDVSVSLQGASSWMNLISSGTVGRIEAGGNCNVTLYFNPQINQSINDYLAKLIIQSSNAPQKEVDLRVSLTQSGEGDALIHVGDIYSNQSNGVTGATVLLESEFTDPNTLTRAVTLSGSTDASGQVFFQGLPAGWYQVRVSADQHNSTIGRLCVIPKPPGQGSAAYLDVNLPYSIVSLSWSVVPVLLEDEYNIVLNATYETKVPAPVVVIDPPSFNLPDMIKGDQFRGQVTLTNMGLLTANQVSFTKPVDDDYFKYELLSPVPSTLEAGQMVVVSYRITCLAPLGNNTAVATMYQTVQNSKGVNSNGCWTYSNCFTERHWVGCLWNSSLGYWTTNYVCTAKSGGVCPNTVGLGATSSSKGSRSMWQLFGTPNGTGPAVIPPGQSMPTIVGQKCFPPPADCQSAPSPLRKSDCDDPPKGPICEILANWNAKSSWVNLPSREYRDEVNDLTLSLPGGKIDVGRRYTSKTGQWKWLDYNLTITANTLPTCKVCGILRGQTRFTPSQLCPPEGTEAALNRSDTYSLFYNDWQSKSEKIVVTYDSVQAPHSIVKFRWSDSNGFWCDYDRTGKLIDTGVRDLTVAHYLYDDSGRVQSIMDGTGEVSYATFVYIGTSHQINQVSDAMGRSVSYGYDSNGLLLSCTHSYRGASRLTASYSYDSQGRMTAKTTEKGAFTLTYDSAGYVHSITDAGGGTTLFDFDYQSPLYYARIIDADGKGTERTFDAMGRLTLEKVDGTVTQTVSYEGFNHILKDDQSRITTRVYDENNNLIRETLPNGAMTLFNYEPVTGRLLRKQDPLGKITSYQYDGELVSMTEGEGTPQVRITLYSGYDQHRPTHVVDPMGIVTDTQYFSNPQAGETVRITVTGTDQSVETRSLEFDGAGNKVASTDAMGQRTEWVRDDRGRILKETNLAADLSTINSYDLVTGDLVQVEVGRSGNVSGRITKYSYDAMHRCIATIAVGDNEVQWVQQRVAYNAAGRVVSETDALGNVTAYGHDPHGNISFVKQNDETIETRLYDETDHLVEVDSYTGAFGTQVTRMTYDFAGHVLICTTGSGADLRSVTYEYQPGGLLGSTVDSGADGLFATNYGYDLFEERTSVTGDVELPSITQYNRSGQVVSVMDGNGNSTFFGYDGMGRPASLTRGSEITRTFYDANGHLIKTVDGEQNACYFKIDPLGRCTDQSIPTTQTWGAGWESNPLNRLIHLVYNVWGEVLATQDAAGGTTAASYDHQGHLLQSTDKNGLTLGYQWDALGRLSQITYPPVNSSASGSSTALVYQYDPVRPDWLVSVTDRAGAVSSAIYDHPSGLKLAEINPLGGANRYTYDSLGRTASVTDPAGNESCYLYDQFDHITQIESANGDVEFRGYDRFGHIQSQSGAGSYAVTYEDDAAGNRVAMTDENHHRTQWSYNASNRLQTKRYADGRQDDYTYDRNGNVATRIDGKRQETDYIYNEYGLLVTILTPNDPAVGYSYDRAGRLLQTTDLTGTTTFGYSNSGLLLSQKAGGRLLTYDYDAEGHRIELTLSSGSNFEQTGMGQIRYRYDWAGRLEKVFDSRVSVNPFQYGWPPGTSMIDHLTLPTGVIHQKSYDSSGRLTGISMKSNTSTINSRHYDYNSASLRASEHDLLTGGVNSFHYDPQHQLTQVDSTIPIQSTRYSYDLIGNKLAQITPLLTGTFSVNNVNQYTAISPPGSTTVFSPIHDANGNLTDNGNGITYSWDDKNQLQSVHTDRNVVEFSTNGLGWRVQKRVFDATGRILQKATRFIYDGVNLIEELDDRLGNPQLLRSYTQGLDDSLTLDEAGGVGGLLCETVYDSSPPTHLYPGFDGNGNIRDWLDHQGAVQSHFDYTPFGQVLSQVGSFNPNFRWSSKYQDDETGLLYYGYRYYDPTFGRWLNRDPIEEQGGINLYGFCGNDPVNGIDHNGLVLVAIDGTDSKEWVEQKHVNSHVLNFYNDYIGTGNEPYNKLYLDGPNILGYGVDSAIDSGYSFICSALKNNINDPIYLVGHSRGGLIAEKIAEKLKEGCPCDIGENGLGGKKSKIEGPIPVRYMGLYDAVSMQMNHWASPVQTNVQFVAYGRRDPEVGSQWIWGNTGLTGGQERIDKTFFGTHSAMGGDPKHGDVHNPRGRNTENKASLQIDVFIRQQAILKGALINH